MKVIQLFAMLFIAVTICACSTTNSTVYKYKYYSDAEVSAQAKKVFIAPFNILVQGRIPQKDIVPVRTHLTNYLTIKGVEVLPQHQFENCWNENLLIVGGLYNQQTGSFSKTKFNEALRLTLENLGNEADFSYVLFPNLVIKPVELKRRSDIGEWDGVRRELPRINVFKNGWRKANAASLYAFIINRDNNVLLHNVGGLDFIQMSTKKGRDYLLTYRDNPFDNDKNVMEGIQIALHPFVDFDEYPEKQGGI